jgi:putative NADH-flavin reductase
MKITLFGATGMVGRHIIELAVLKDITVRAFGRNVFEKLPTERNNLELFKGYVFQEDDVEAALDGADAVLSALGGDTGGEDKTRSLGMKTIAAAMEKTGVKRIVAVGGVGILKADEHTLIFQTPKFPAVFKPVSEEHFKAWQHLVKSSLDWTMVCPPMIVDAGLSGKYFTKQDYPALGAGRINAGDLADFMLREITERQFVKSRVGITS